MLHDPWGPHAFTVPGTQPRTAAGETSDGYARVVAQIGAAERIIRCRHDLQFIAQRRENGPGQWPWRSFWYFRTPAGAARLSGGFRAPALALFGLPRTTGCAE